MPPFNCRGDYEAYQRQAKVDCGLRRYSVQFVKDGVQ